MDRTKKHSPCSVTKRDRFACVRRAHFNYYPDIEIPINYRVFFASNQDRRPIFQEIENELFFFLK